MCSCLLMECSRELLTYYIRVMEGSLCLPKHLESSFETIVKTKLKLIRLRSLLDLFKLSLFQKLN